jgi:hypothetical protein
LHVRAATISRRVAGKGGGMTDNAEMGERPADPATRGGVGVGAGPDDYADGMAEEQMERLGETGTPAGQAQGGAQQDGPPPGEAQTPFADTDAASAGMQPVDEWGTGDREKPQETPKDELDSDV